MTTSPHSLSLVVRVLIVIAVAAGVTSRAHAGQGGAAGGSQWTIVATYPIPEGASGLAWDGVNLYCGIYGADGGRIYEIDPSNGASTLVFTGAHEDAYGLTYDGQFLWTTDHPGSSSTPAQALKLDWSGAIIDQFDLPDHYMSGIVYDNGDFWVSRYHPNPGHIYQVDDTGLVLDSFVGPDDQPWDLTFENGAIWIADYFGDMLWKVDPATGSVLDSQPSEGVDPAGIVWDGQHLWYCDNGDDFGVDFLYKIDLQGSGAPGISIPVASHGFGNVSIGDTAIWNVDIDSIGDADLVISDVTFAPATDLTCLTALPLVIPMGTSDQITIEYAPSGFGPLDATATVVSDDPIHPNEPLALTGDGLYPDPTIDLAATAHDYGSVRVGAHTRWFIDVTNQGNQTLVISDISSDDASFYIDGGAQTPINLAPLGTTQIGVWFSPTSAAAAAATVTISSNDAARAPALVAVSGSGLEQAWPIGTSLWSYVINEGFDNSPKAMKPIPDVTGDGRADVIVCSEDYFIRCFNGNAHATGDVIWEHEIVGGPVYSGKGLFIVPDINEDEIHDVLVGATGGARLIRMLSGATGAEIWTYDTDVVGDGGWVYQVDGSRDFTGDGILDVLACAGDDSSDTGPKRAYCLNGFNGALVWQLPLGGPVFGIIAVDDFTGDSVPDAVAGASNESETQGRAVGINGATGLEEWSYPVAGSSVWALAQINDITNDGIADVIVGDFATGEVHGLDATDGADSYTVAGLGTLTGFHVMGDVNGNGFTDILPEHFGSFVRVINSRNGTALWTTPVVDKPSVAARIDDISGDGISDVAAGTLFGNNFTYFINGLTGAVLDSANYGQPVDAITVIPDVVGDGSWEMVAGGRDGLVTCISGGVDALVFDPADTNQDGVVDVVDLLDLLSAWGVNPGHPADINMDGVVDVIDLLALLAAWS